MKITINIDCTPIEARTFFGLPDVTALNDAMVSQMQMRFEKGLDPQEVDQAVRAWMSGASAGLGEWQKAFWAAMKGAVGPTDPTQGAE